ncbi:PH-like domain-containing protein [Brachybacterium sp. AOP43-C2-M15]|uniref:PH-like domain-containing protein n=1 Tax=Brachybacterium sp. AOP43-C2-M15 TaxID=3457661 RepID=UPI00403378AB
MSDRLVPVLLLLLLFAAILAAMALGWRRRGRTQQDLPVPDASSLEQLGEGIAHGPVEAVYVDTVLAEQPLERVVAHGLGRRAAARVTLGDGGTWRLERAGAPDLTIPATAVTELTSGPGMAGKFIGGDGLLIIRWRLGDRLLDTGLRLHRRADHDLLLSRKEHA